MAAECWHQGCTDDVQARENGPVQYVVPVRGTGGQVRFYALVASCTAHVPDPTQPGYWEGVSLAWRLDEYSGGE